MDACNVLSSFYKIVLFLFFTCSYVKWHINTFLFILHMLYITWPYVTLPYLASPLLCSRSAPPHPPTVWAARSAWKFIDLISRHTHPPTGEFIGEWSGSFFFSLDTHPVANRRALGECGRSGRPLYLFFDPLLARGVPGRVDFISLKNTLIERRTKYSPILFRCNGRGCNNNSRSSCLDCNNCSVFI